MANAKRDQNYVTTMIGANILDLTDPQLIGVDPTNNRMLVSAIITSGGSAGTQYAELVTTAPGTGTLALGRYKSVAPTLTDGQMYGLQLDTSGNLKVTGSLSVGGTTDNSAYTAGSSTGTPTMGFYHSTIDTVTDGRSAAVGMTSKRGMFVNLQASGGTELLPTAALADATSNPTTPSMGALPLVFNGTTWDRAKSVQGLADNVAGVGMPAVGGYVYDGTTWYKLRGGLGDGSAAAGLLANNALLYNGSTYDRQRSAPGVTGASAIAGFTASGSSLVAAPVTAGGLAKTANPTAVSDGQVVNATFDKLGKQVVVGSIRDLKVQQQTTITSSTAETTILTAVASTFLDVYGVSIANSSATATKVTIKDATAGTTRIVIYVPAGDTRGFMLPESGAHSQAATNNNWTATSSASVASLDITVWAVKNT